MTGIDAMPRELGHEIRQRNLVVMVMIRKYVNGDDEWEFSAPR